MPVGARVALIVALLTALLGVVMAGHVAAGFTATAPQVNSTGAADRANVTLAVDVQSDGDARWRVSTTFDLATEAERQEFRSLASAFESGETSALGLDAFRRASREASVATGRDMTVSLVERRSSPDAVVENGTGRLTVVFTWTNFGQVDGDRLRLDDVFLAGPDKSTWMPGLDDGDSLIIRGPEGYGVADSNAAPQYRDNRPTLQWFGPAEFDANTLAAAFTGQGTPTPTPGGPQPSVPWPLVFTVGLGGGVVAVYLLARHRNGDGDGVGLPSPPTGNGDDDGPATGAQTAAGSGQTAGADATDAAAIDEDLLSDEERVERLLERNGGRMKQASIVKETGWSNAKVSQLLSSMEAEGRIDKLRIGRENLISFPEEDVTDIEE
jgi:hypothetical protein